MLGVEMVHWEGSGDDHWRGSCAESAQKEQRDGAGSRDGLLGKPGASLQA